MNISIFGLGYVGAVSAACFADAGHTVVGVDLNPIKVDAINAGTTPVSEKHVPEMIEAAVADGRLRATLDIADAILSTDITLICVGTPSRSNGDIDISHILKVAADIGSILAGKDTFHTVTVRSTVFPGTSELVAEAIAESSGMTPDVDFAVTVNPEFLREGQGVEDFHDPSLILIGGSSPQALDALASLYDGIDAPLYREDARIAEMVKYANNSFHATKITFANEIGNIAKAMGVDSHRVMELLCADTKLNISPALQFRSKSLDLSSPLLDSLLESNAEQIRRVIDQLIGLGLHNIGFVGLAFKSGTDDLRESPIVEVIERMIGKGFLCRIYDPEVSTGKLIGANRDYIEREIPHLDDLLVTSLDEVIEHADVIVVASDCVEAAQLLQDRRPGQHVIDLARIVEQPIDDDWYHGICW